MRYTEAMKRIGLMIERHWHYGRRLCEGIAAVSRETGGLSLEFLAWDAIRDMKVLRTFDGFIARIRSDAMASALKASGRPVVDVYSGESRRGFVLVDQNAALIGRLAVRHFTEHHFRSFGFCGYANQNYSVLRREAFVRELERRRLPCCVFEERSLTANRFGQTIFDTGSYDSGIDRTSLARWLRTLEKPVAVFCAHDLVALDLTRTCREIGLEVPREVAVLGVDDDPLLCDFSNPTLSSIDPNPFEIGRQAARSLIQWIAAPAHKPEDIRPAPVGIVERMSTRTYPFPEPWLTDALVFIRQNVAKNLNASDVIAFLKLSHTTVGKAFRARLGSSVRQEIARVRIEEAKRLLEQTSLPLADVCREAGFSSKAYFTAAFREATDTTPLAWRRTHRL